MIGDRAFDDQFHVEGAPSDVVRRVVGPEIRQLMLAHQPCHLQLIRGELNLLIEDVARLDVEAAIAVIAACAAATPEHAREAAIARDRATSDAPGYRPAPDRALVAARHRLAHLELAYLRQDAHHDDRVITAWMALGAVLYVAAAFALLPLGHAFLALLGLPFSTLASMLGYVATGMVVEASGLGGVLRRRRHARLDRALAGVHREIAPGPPLDDEPRRGA